MKGTIALARELAEKLAEFIVEKEESLETTLENPKNFEDLMLSIRVLLPYKLGQKLSEDKNFLKQEELIALLALSITINGE